MSISTRHGTATVSTIPTKIAVIGSGNAEVSVTADHRGLHVKLPFDLKDGFRAAFKTATWDSYSKTWLLNDTTVTRNKLTKYIDTLTASGVVDALSNQQELEATQAEVERWASDLAKRKALIQHQIDQVGKLDASKAKLVATRGQFDALQSTVDEGRAKLDAAQAEVAAAAKSVREKVDELLALFPDARAWMEQARREWRRLAFGKYQAKRDAEEAQAALGRIYEEIKEQTGVGLEALHKAYMCNPNRTDRDDVGRELDRLYTTVTFPKATE